MMGRPLIVKKIAFIALRFYRSVIRARGQLAKYLYFAHPMKRDVKEKTSPRPSGRCGCGVLTSSPTSFLTSFLEGLLVWSLWLAALSRGDANPSGLSQLDGFMKSVALDAVRFRSYAS